MLSPIESRSEVLEFKTSMYAFGRDEIQPIPVKDLRLEARYVNCEAWLLPPPPTTSVAKSRPVADLLWQFHPESWAEPDCSSQKHRKCNHPNGWCSISCCSFSKISPSNRKIHRKRSLGSSEKAENILNHPVGKRQEKLEMLFAPNKSTEIKKFENPGHWQYSGETGPPQKQGPTLQGVNLGSTCPNHKCMLQTQPEIAPLGISLQQYSHFLQNKVGTKFHISVLCCQKVHTT